MPIASAIYPGSFDPITYGHIDIVRRAKKLFDRLVIAIVENPNKSALFTAAERVEITRRALTEEGLRCVEVMSYSGLLVDVAKSMNVEAIVRGLRANSDFDYEFQMAFTNRNMNAIAETVFLMPNEKYTYLNSTMVKQIARLGGDVTSFVPKCVSDRLARKLSHSTQSN